MNLSQEQAQELVDTYVKHTEEARQAPFKAYQDLTDKWRQEASDHPDLRGRLGPGKEVTVRIARALNGIGDSELASQFRELMDLTGAGNHPAFIRVLDKFARQLTEGNAVQPGNRPSPAGQSRSGDTSPPGAAAAMWPNLKSSMNR